jgi:hypothetical protein
LDELAGAVGVPVDGLGSSILFLIDPQAGLFHFAFSDTILRDISEYLQTFMYKKFSTCRMRARLLTSAFCTINTRLVNLMHGEIVIPARSCSP